MTMSNSDARKRQQEAAKESTMSEPKVTLTDEELQAVEFAVIDDRDRQNGYRVMGPGGTDGQTPTLREAVQSIVAHRVAEALRDAADDGETAWLKFKTSWGSNPPDQQTIKFALWVENWLRDRANSYDPTGGTDGK